MKLKLRIFAVLMYEICNSFSQTCIISCLLLLLLSEFFSLFCCVPLRLLNSRFCLLILQKYVKESQNVTADGQWSYFLATHFTPKQLLPSEVFLVWIHISYFWRIASLQTFQGGIIRTTSSWELYFEIFFFRTFKI